MQPSFQVLVACSANVCRSPLAASVIRAEVASLGSTVFVSWVGTYAAIGDAMCPQAASFLGREGQVGSSRQVTAPLLSNSDLLLTADRTQRAWLARMDPSTRSRTFTLRQGARLASSIIEQIKSGNRPDGSPALPEDAQDRLRWLVNEMDAARGAHASWDPRDDDIDDLHSDEEHHQTLEAVAQASRELAQVFVAIATVDSSRLIASPQTPAAQFAYDGQLVAAPRPRWFERLIGRQRLTSAADLNRWLDTDYLGEMNSSTPTYSRILLTRHPEIEQHLQRALAHADLYKSKSYPSIVVVTSTREGAGKTATAISLATGFAHSGRSVVLVDADLRESKLSIYLGIEPEVGLPDVVAGLVSVDEALITWHRGLISVLTCGRQTPDPLSLLSSDHCAALMTQLRQSFDMVIVNAPPLCDWDDALPLSAAAEGTVLVAARGRTTRRDVKECADSLHRHQAQLLGSIMTVAPAAR